ncbi:MAG TPA: hypothetical protein VFX73_00665 [Chitinophagaceae bacterium]|nr:hypothetical protein [Chitinophagaceae bacterium]
MMQEQSSGDYLKTYLTNIPADTNSTEFADFSRTIPRFPEEAVYIYSLKQGRMIYAAGWEEVLG